MRERCFGLFEGLTRAECETQQPVHWQRYLDARGELLPPGAEAHAAVAERMRDGVQALALRPEPGPALVVSHGSAIRTLVAAATGRPWPPMENGAVFRVLVRAGAPDRASAIVGAEPLV